MRGGDDKLIRISQYQYELKNFMTIKKTTITNLNHLWNDVKVQEYKNPKGQDLRLYFNLTSFKSLYYIPLHNNLFFHVNSILIFTFYLNMCKCILHLVKWKQVQHTKTKFFKINKLLIVNIIFWFLLYSQNNVWPNKYWMESFIIVFIDILCM
jgi:hypothetical protein